MTKAKKDQKIKESLSDAWYYISEGFKAALVIAWIAGTSILLVGGAFYLIAAPMQYWSPWWGLVSIPTVITLGFAGILWWVDR